MDKVHTLQAASAELASMVEWALERWARDACAGIVQHREPSLPEFRWVSDSRVELMNH